MGALNWMATVIAVRFQKAGKLYYFDPAGIWANPGDHVIVVAANSARLKDIKDILKRD